MFDCTVKKYLVVKHLNIADAREGSGMMESELVPVFILVLTIKLLNNTWSFKVDVKYLSRILQQK
jgi:hypothetical protein